MQRTTDSNPGRRTTTHPIPRMPLVVGASAFALLAVGIVAAIHGAFAFAGFLVATAMVPGSRGPRARGLHLVLALGGLVWCVVGIATASSPPFVAALGALVLRLWALRTEAAFRWTDARWFAGTSAAVIDTQKALVAALQAPPGDQEAVDRAVVALALTSADVVPADETARRAFWLNVYNVLAIHAGRGRRSKWIFNVLEVFRTQYEIAGIRLSPDDIEHGLLRDGARPPTGWGKMRPGDPRRRWSVPLDPRIHFALHCGAVSCPPLRVYDGARLEQQLELAMESFVAGESSVDPDSGEVWTSRLFDWYAADFGGEAGVRRVLGRVLGIDEAHLSRLRIRFCRYDWRNPS